jgi:heat shock protein HslJ
VSLRRRRDMRRSASLLLLLVALAPVVAACGDDGGTTASTASPWGRTFVTDGPPPVRLWFDDGQVSVRSECNTLSGTAALDGDVLQVSDVGGTEMGCDPDLHAYDQWLAAFLTSSPTMTLDGPTLTLTAGADTLVLTDREVADPDRPLVGTRWVVDGIVTGDAVSSMPAWAGEAWLTFTESRVEGSGGCNDLFADVTVGDATIDVGGLTHTDMGCGTATMDVETAVQTTLRGTVGYSIEASTLTLTGPDDHGLLLRADE